MPTPLGTLTFDAGTAGTALAAGGMVSAVSGSHNYNAAAAFHGAMGLVPVSATSAGPTFTVSKTSAGITAANGSHAESIYYTPTSVPGGAVQLLQLQNSANATIGWARCHSNGHFDLAASGPTVLATTALSWVSGTKYRIDVIYNGATNVATLNVFVGANIEGTVPDETITGTFSTQTGGYDHTLISAGRSTTAGCTGNLDTVRFYDGAVTPDPFSPPAGDTTAPTVPSGVVATPNSGTQVTVTWNASTDAVGVTQYQIKRGGTAIGTVTGSPPALTYVDTTVTPGNVYSYTVNAADAAGNRSADSSAASATTPAPAGAVAHLWVGANTPGGFTLTAKVSGTTSLKCAVSTSASMTSPTLSTVGVPDAQGYVTFTISGLAANTQYYYQLQDTPSGGSATPIGSVGKAKTFPTAGSPANFNFAAGSCITTNPTDPVALDDMRTWAPLFQVFTGDFHYMGGTVADTLVQEANWASQIASLAALQNMIRDVPMFYCTSDHEVGPDNGDSNNAYTQSNIDAYKIVVPHPPLADTRNPTVGRYFSWVVGRVRFIMTDCRNEDRSPGANTDNASKTMLGATQKAWLKARLSDPEPVKVIITDPGWMGAATTTNSPDKWWSYSTERQEITDYITSHGIKCLLIHGDTHCVGVATPAKNTWGNFPVYCASPYHNTGGGLNLSTFSSYYNNAGGNARQYGRIAVTDDGNNISFTFQGWDAVSGTAKVTQTDTFSAPATSTKKVKAGSADPILFVGSTGVAKMYVGSNQVWP